MGLPEPGDIPDLCRDENRGIIANAGYGHEELGILVLLGNLGDLCGDILDLVFESFEYF